MPDEKYDGMTVTEALKVEGEAQGEVETDALQGGAHERVSDVAEIIDEIAEIDPLDEVLAAVGVGEGVDPVDALISAPRVVDTDTVTLKRLNAVFTVQAIDDDRKYDKLVERCTSIVRNRRGGGRSREVDGRRLAKLTVVEYTVYPGFKPSRKGYEKLAERYGVTDPEALVSEALYIGEIDALADKILDISGFDDDLDNAGN